MEQRPKKLLDQVRDALRLKHYSLSTEESYVAWTRRYILFHNKRHPNEMGSAEVETFLTHLAVKETVAASTQNQAFGALLFLYRQVLKKDLEGGAVRGGLASRRPRPYRKNDQAHVEQRNWSIVRQLIGYDRYEGDATAAFNALWEKRRLYVNFFQPVRKLLKKERIDGKVRKEYDEARTPYHRLMNSIDVTPERKAELTTLYESLDPVALKRDCDRLLRRLWDKHTVRFLADAPAPSK